VADEHCNEVVLGLHRRKDMTKISFAGALFLTLAGLLYSVSASAQHEAEQNIAWCVNNDGHVDCPEYYAIGNTSLAGCAAGSIIGIPGSGRQCAMDIAIAAAHNNYCTAAHWIAQLCQCHNGHAQQTIRDYGVMNTCNFLKGYDSYTGVALEIARALAAALGAGG
jgi:hypothetical protein